MQKGEHRPAAPGEPEVVLLAGGLHEAVGGVHVEDGPRLPPAHPRLPPRLPPHPAHRVRPQGLRILGP